MSTFVTTDMALAAALQVHACRIRYGLDAESQKVQFCFEDGEDLKTLIDQYERDELLVEPKRYVHILSQTRKRVYEITGVTPRRTR